MYRSLYKRLSEESLRQRGDVGWQAEGIRLKDEQWTILVPLLPPLKSRPDADIRVGLTKNCWKGCSGCCLST